MSSEKKGQQTTYEVKLITTKNEIKQIPGELRKNKQPKGGGLAPKYSSISEGVVELVGRAVR